MVKQIIPADWYKHRKVFQKDGENFLNISEFYYDTIQGEGIYTGVPAAFLRLQGCPLNCVYCDTKEVWRYGSRYTFEEIFKLMDQYDIVDKLSQGQHLILTGGSPLLQQERLHRFLYQFYKIYDFLPYLEIENECVISLDFLLDQFIDCWNNSPKLSSSGVKRSIRYKPEVIKRTASLNNSWFKFVVDCREDWEEILEDFLLPKLIRKDQIILMPEGSTKLRLLKNSPIVVEMAVEHGVRYSDRLHIQLWGKKTGC